MTAAPWHDHIIEDGPDSPLAVTRQERDSARGRDSEGQT